MTTSIHPALPSQPTPSIHRIGAGLLAGDLLVEGVGNDVRFWRVIDRDGKLRIVYLGHSSTFLRKRFYNPVSGSPVEATDLTLTKVYKAEPAAARELIGKYIPDLSRIFLCYSGRGPSGSYWFGNLYEGDFKSA